MDIDWEITTSKEIYKKLNEADYQRYEIENNTRNTIN